MTIYDIQFVDTCPFCLVINSQHKNGSRFADGCQITLVIGYANINCATVHCAVPTPLPEVEHYCSNYSVWEQEYFDRTSVGSEPYLSLTGQELAPGLSGLVAVASSGLYPPPLWISATVGRHY